MKFRLSLISALLAVWISTSAQAETIVLAVPGPGNLAFLPVYLAKAIAADQDEGINLKLRYFSGGPLAMRDLVTNNSDFMVIGLPAIAEARADGMPVVAIGQLSQSAMFVFLLRSDLNGEVTSIAKLKGHRIGTPTGTAEHRTMGQMIAEHLLRLEGINSGDVQFIPTGLNRESQSAALSSGTVDAIMADEPFASELAAEGKVVILADMYSPQQSKKLLGSTIVRAALATREDVYVRHPETVNKIMRMFDRSLQWIARHSPQELTDILADQPGFIPEQRKLLTDILQRNRGMFPSQITWDTQAVATTEQFFHRNASTQAEAHLPFSDFIRNSPGD
ncbi:MAG: ABC transporter substrate-binding protein [Gallionella sp.]